MLFETKELQQRYTRDAEFRKKVDKSEDNYRQMLGKVKDKQSEIAEHITENILQKFTQQCNHSIYFFYGILQPPPGTHTLQLTLFFLKNFHPQPKEKFIFVYFNNQTPSSDYYFQFKYILTLLPLRLVQNLQDFILVKPYFYIKAHDYVGLGSINKIFSQRYRTLQNCTELCSHLKIQVHDFVSFVPEEISTQFPKNIKRRPSLINYRFNLQGQNLTESQRRQKSQFQLAINSLVTKEVYKLENYQLGEFGIPVIIQLLIHYFRTKPDGLKEQGMFRKSVSIDQQNQTLEQLSQRNYEYLQQIKNPFLIACLIKRFFSNLKQPIIPFATYQAMLHDQGVVNKKQHVKKYVQSLPKLNFLTIAFLFQFLIKDVIPQEKFSKMGANNLAICFSPSLMRSEKTSMVDLINASKAVYITNIMLANFQQIFGTEQERNQMYKQNAIIKKKDFTNALRKELQIYEEEKIQLHQDHQSRHSSIIIDIAENASIPRFGSNDPPQHFQNYNHKQFYIPQQQTYIPQQVYINQQNNITQQTVYTPQPEVKQVIVGARNETYLNADKQGQMRRSGGRVQQTGGIEQRREQKVQQSGRRSKINFNYQSGKGQ